MWGCCMLGACWIVFEKCKFICSWTSRNGWYLEMSSLYGYRRRDCSLSGYRESCAKTALGITSINTLYMSLTRTTISRPADKSKNEKLADSSSFVVDIGGRLGLIFLLSIRRSLLYHCRIFRGCSGEADCQCAS